jgi:class 3 adenylate cyclase
MTGGSRLLYDVWGDTVTAAHHLARRAGSGAIVLSDATHALLPDEVAQRETDVDGSHAWQLATGEPAPAALKARP